MLLAFLLIIGLSFAVMAIRLTNYVSNYLYEQRIRQDSVSVERLASAVAPLFVSRTADRLNDTIVSSAGELGGRLMVIDTDGKIQFDSYGDLLGIRMQLPEVLQVLTTNQNNAVGIRRIAGTSDAADWYSFCAVRLLHNRQTVGVLVYTSDVNEMIGSLERVQRQLGFVFIFVAIVAMLAALGFSHLLTAPIARLTNTIRRMGKGDLSVRVPVKGSSELRNLAESYNTMASQLETLDRSRNQFVSNASHELKTPLATMKILLENLLYQPDMPEEIRSEFLGDINHEIDRLTNIVTDLLTLTKIDDHKLELKRERIDVSSLVRDTVRVLEPTAQQRNQKLTTNIQDNVMAFADSSKLSQVIYNLTENALKYTGDGGEVTTALQQKGKSIIITVKDTGVGIPKEDLEHIFERFYRVDKARSRETGGTGLGLSIVRQLVLLHGGTIGVESEMGKGSTFTVILPAEEEA